MLTNIKISIVMAVFNQVNVIEQAISSVVEQTYKNIELIIIDGASTDGTVDIIKRYSDKGRIAYWCSEADDGIYFALNKGIDIATGDYIHILGSDDSFVDEQIIEHVVKILGCNPYIDVLSAPVWLIDEDMKMQQIYSNSCAANKTVYNGGMIPHQGMFVKKEIIKKYKFDTTYRLSGDYEFFLKCYTNPDIKFLFTDKPVVFYANSGASSMLKCYGDKENAIIEKIYNVQSIKSKCYSIDFFKTYLRELLRKMHLLGFVSKIYSGNWIEHKCNNKICRWCGRKSLN